MQFSQPALTAIDARLQDSYAYLSSVRVTRNPLDSTLSVDLFSSAGIPQASAWTCGKKVHVTLPGPVKLVGVVSESWKLLLLPVEIRLSKDQYELNEDFFESHKPEVLIQQVDQRQDPVTNYWIHQKLAAFEKVKEDDALSIWTRALFAGRAYDFQINEDPEVITVIKRKKTVELTREQAVYVDTFLKGAKALIGSSSFGCGKSLTIAVAADRRAQMDDGLHLMLAATNYATANLTWMSSDIEDDHSRPLLRLITENNRKMVPDASKTFYDSPEVIVEVFHEYLTKLDTRFFNKEYPVIDFRKNEVVLGYLQSRKAFRYNELRSKYVRRMVAKQWPAADPMRTIDVFLELSNTGRICATIGTALAHFCNVWRSHAERVMSVQIDESSQLKLSEFIALLNLFPSAQFSLVGDKNQLPPFSPIETPQLIEKLAIGEILEDLERLGTVPRVEFNGVFRCPPDITQMLSKNFYDDRLWSVKDRYYQSFFIKRFGMWPNREFHVTFVDHDYESWLRGYTRVCPDEMRFALELAARIGDEDPKAKVAILALYRGQADLLQVCCDAYLPVFTGTVDSCQGREFDVVIILTTRSGEEAHPSEFLGCPKRINVAMSRAKEAVFIVGSEADLIELPHWRRILDEIHRQDAFTSVDDYFSSWRLSFPANPIPNYKKTFFSPRTLLLFMNIKYKYITVLKESSFSLTQSYSRVDTSFKNLSSYFTHLVPSRLIDTVSIGFTHHLVSNVASAWFELIDNVSIDFTHHLVSIAASVWFADPLSMVARPWTINSDSTSLYVQTSVPPSFSHSLFKPFPHASYALPSMNEDINFRLRDLRNLRHVPPITPNHGLIPIGTRVCTFGFYILEHEPHAIRLFWDNVTGRNFTQREIWPQFFNAGRCTMNGITVVEHYARYHDVEIFNEDFVVFFGGEGVPCVFLSMSFH
ncbi:unnamed protein product [Caenorhabditis auriculariae]|uniref:DNA2/NAM7 helicase-like C-terminal domain-containing protein n=1 Tax=Caenorhabditis auriculariae TaxID=2777116 RepID=A0A8S1HGK5_9PELO|nr:unnamed protein product [Caenorhabditis auriculariae]